MISEIKRYINAEIVLGYLKVPFSAADEVMLQKANESIEAVLNHAQIKTVTEVFDVSLLAQQIDFHTASGTATVRSNDLAIFLEQSNQVVVAAVTLGHAVSRLIKRTLVMSPSDAVYLDAAASAIADATCDYIQDSQTASVMKAGKFSSGRFSPGYGDLELSTQATFLHLIGAEKRIGCHLTSAYLLVPEKSVIFVMGISTVAYTGNTKTCSGNCGSCPMEYCRFRRSSVEKRSI